MVNNNTSINVTRATLSDEEVLAILNLTGIPLAKVSPLGQITGQPGMPDIQKLQSAGLTDSAGRPTAAFREALSVLANPASEIDLIWGNPDGISLSKVYAAAGKDNLVSFSSMNNTSNISFFLSPQDITDLLVQKLVFAEIKNIAPLNIEIPLAALPVLFAALDAYRENQLKAVLERRQEMPVSLSAEELNRLVQEAKTETSFNWYTPVSYNIMPPETAITENVINEGFKILIKENLVSSGGEMSGELTTFAARAFPIMSFFGIKVLTLHAGSLEKAQLALFRGLSTLLLAQITSENGQEIVSVSSISTSQLPELFFNLSTRPFEVTTPLPAQPATQPAPAIIACSKCGTQNDAKSKFCGKCGAPLAGASSGPKFCPKCGDPVTPSEKFCDKCGTALK